MRCQRQILRIRWYDFVTNTAVSIRTGLAPIRDTITRQRSGLCGHIARLDSSVPAECGLDSAI